MSSLLPAVQSPVAVVAGIAVFVLLFPRTTLGLILRMFPKAAERRRELVGEFAVIPWTERPLWVMSQLEVGIREGLTYRLLEQFPQAIAATIVGWGFKSQTIRDDLIEALPDMPPHVRPYWAARWAIDGMSERWHIADPLPLASEYPDTFWLPSADDKAAVEPGWNVKLMFETRDEERWCERMWVHVTQRRGERLIGRLDNCPIGIARLGWGTKVRFSVDDIIDFNDAPKGW